MCYIHGSIDQAIGICPMCKVFKPSASRCPHVKDVCRNRQLHPAHDVVYLKNAEVLTFQGCGYCKWARANPSPRPAGFLANPGWPGCCRAPASTEHIHIPPADWHAVAVVHRVQTPPEIRLLLESARGALTAGPGQARVAAAVAPQQSSPKAAHAAPPQASPPKTSIALAKPLAAPLVIPAKTRTSSPKSGASPLRAPSSPPQPQQGTSPVAPPAELRRTATAPTRDASPGSRPASTRRAPAVADTDGSTLGRRSAERPRRPTASSLASSLAQVALDERPGMKRRGSAADAVPALLPVAAGPPRLVDVKNTPVRGPRKAPGAGEERARRAVEVLASAPMARPLAPSKPVSSGSSDGSNSSGARSESTITSEGFTDYLSDESEAELQKQAEIKAAQVTQNSQEDQEFRAARKQLATVGLRPPKAWESATVGARAGKDLYVAERFQPRKQINVMEYARSK